MARSKPDFAAERQEMVKWQLSRRGITDRRILDAFLQVPREAFLSSDQQRLAYGDHPLPIEAGQTISQPYIVALMIEAAEIGRGDRVLEIGAGSGYAAAVMSLIVDRVVTIERHPKLARIAAERMKRFRYRNVRVIEGDGSRGCPEEAPFNAIIAAASGSHIPRTLVDQLTTGGQLVMPVGEPSWVQRLVKATKRTDGSIDCEDLGGVRFVPLIGAESWKDA